MSTGGTRPAQCGRGRALTAETNLRLQLPALSPFGRSRRPGRSESPLRCAQARVTETSDFPVATRASDEPQRHHIGRWPGYPALSADPGHVEAAIADLR